MTQWGITVEVISVGTMREKGTRAPTYFVSKNIIKIVNRLGE